MNEMKRETLYTHTQGKGEDTSQCCRCTNNIFITLYAMFLYDTKKSPFFILIFITLTLFSFITII